MFFLLLACATVAPSDSAENPCYAACYALDVACPNLGWDYATTDNAYDDCTERCDEYDGTAGTGPWGACAAGYNTDGGSEGTCQDIVMYCGFMPCSTDASNLPCR